MGQSSSAPPDDPEHARKHGEAPPPAGHRWNAKKPIADNT